MVIEGLDRVAQRYSFVLKSNPTPCIAEKGLLAQNIFNPFTFITLKQSPRVAYLLCGPKGSLPQFGPSWPHFRDTREIESGLCYLSF